MKHKKWLLLSIEILIIWILLANVGIAYVSGNSMMPALETGDILIYTRWGSKDEGDIIIFQSETYNRLLIKRIEKVENEQYYVLGDNLSNSEDSRNPLIGWVPEEKVKGRVIFRIYPFGRWGD